jgi:phage tail sheath protein FI
MATTYLAPGVYVEEVPSAAQPIAGVGTNTVGFVGIVPDEIQIPVANEHYDEYLAQTLALGPGTKGFEAAQSQLKTLMDGAKDSDELKAANARVSDLEKQVDDAKKKLAARESELSKTPPEAAPPEGGTAPPKRTAAALKAVIEADQQRNELSNIVTQLQADLGDARLLAAPDDSRYLLPYRMRTVPITVPVLDTKLCTNFTEYTDRFGSYPADDPKFKSHRALTHAVAGFFKNGGTRCFVSRIARPEQLEDALLKFETIDEVALIAAPGITGRSNWGKLVDHCNTTEDRFAILDCDDEVHEGGKPDELDVTLLNYGEKPSEFMPDRTKNAAFYFPYIEVVDPAKQLMDRDPKRNVWIKNRGKLFVPPSGHVAGVYARVDEQRGVHKAPANEALYGATNVKYYVSKRHQALLNPQGVNCIRNMNGNITVYGGRTVGGDRNSEWKYVNVRRVMLFLKESIDEGTQWVVFEPNDPSLWAKIRLNVGAFLTRVWKSGALFGLAPQEAFYVKCDAETNPPEVRDVGQVIIEVGVAIVRPAEFVIFRVTQWAGPTKS